MIRFVNVAKGNIACSDKRWSLLYWITQCLWHRCTCIQCSQDTSIFPTHHEAK